MSKKITYKSTIQVEGGPTIEETTTIEVEAYGVIEVTVPAKTTGSTSTASSGVATVEVQPGEAGQVQFMLLHLEKGNYADELTYEVNEQGEPIKLDGPQTFIGDGAVSLLGLASQSSGGASSSSSSGGASSSSQSTPAPKSLKFTNGTSSAAAVQILVGRKATISKATQPT